MISQGCHTWMPDKCLIIPQNILLSLHALSPCSFLHHTEPFKCHCKNYLSKVFIYYLASQLFLLWTPTDLAYASLYHSSLLSFSLLLSVTLSLCFSFSLPPSLLLCPHPQAPAYNTSISITFPQINCKLLNERNCVLHIFDSISTQQSAFIVYKQVLS